MTIWISPKTLPKILSLIVLSLTIINIAIQFSIYLLDYGHPVGLGRLFMFGRHSNIPKWFASSSLLLSALLLVAIAWSKISQIDAYRRHWSALALIFFAISLEESIGYHEVITEPLRSALNLQGKGFLIFPWVLLGMIVVPIVGLIFFRFLCYLPTNTRKHFLLAATLYVGGALGMKILRGPHITAYGIENMTAAMLKTVEESSQMMGVVVFIYALLSYLAAHVKEVHMYLNDRTLQSSRPFSNISEYSSGND
jgi:hypothetical protein